MLANW